MLRAKIAVVGPVICWLGCLVFAAAPGPAFQASLPASPLSGLKYDAPYVLLADGSEPHYDASIATPESILGFAVGTRAATHTEIERCLKAWDGKGAGGARARLFQHGKTWEGRTLYHIAIGSTANLARLDAIMLGLEVLGDPRSAPAAQTAELTKSLPAVAWLGFSIHGDETSGADAAVQLAYHLIASTDPETTDLLEKTLIVIDPMMNPDGRDRFLKMIAENRAAQPNVDDQSLLHTGYWPAGRWNHYWFDMNRDWIYATQPETRGRIEAIRRWNPLLFVDAHEMGSQDTYLFAPSREPYNPNHPPNRMKWNQVFAADQAKAFDARGWTYYTGEWNEGWYPGYSDSYSAFRGAVGILYEQAGYAEDGVRQRSGRIATYREAVHHQLTSARANLGTLAAHKDELLREYAAERRSLADGSNASYAKRAWAIDSAALNPGRRKTLRELLTLHGIEAKIAAAPFTAQAADRWGVRAARRFEAGTWLIPGAQPEALLAAVLFEFDPRMPAPFLESERREILRTGRSRLYDITAWNLPMVMDLPTYTLDEMPTTALRELPDELVPAPLAGSTVGWIADGDDDRAAALAARLMERGVMVRVSVKSTLLSGKLRPRGSVVVTHIDNDNLCPGLPATVREVAGQLGIGVEALATGLGPGTENSDLGSQQFPLLQPPRIAIVTRGVSDMSAGEAWFEIDQRLGVRATLLEAESFAQVDLRRYNVIVLPSVYGANPALKAKDALKAWISAGGTLIAIGESATQWAAKEGGLESVRTLTDALDSIAEFEQTVLREAIAPTATVDADAIYARGVASSGDFPWSDTAQRPELVELKRRDAWQSLFMPGGSVLAARTDDHHWLTIGCGPMLPVLFRGNALVTKTPAETPVRFGVLTSEPVTTAKQPARLPVGWSALPSGKTVQLRLSGLLWPEAAARLANAAYVAREAEGAGQTILFASSPLFRGGMVGTARLFQNAVVFGPGLGAQPAIQP